MSDPYAVNPFAPPEAVVADVQEPGAGLQQATRSNRLTAGIVDGLINGALLWALWIPLGLLDRGGPALSMFMIKALLLGWASYALVNGWWLHTRGQTVGKRLLGLRVVRLDGSAASLVRLLGLRYGLTVSLSAVPAVGQLLAIVDALFIFGGSQRCLHDLVADTRVVTAASSTGVYLQD